MKNKYIVLVLCVVCLLTYFNSLNGVFVSDDQAGMIEKPSRLETTSKLSFEYNIRRNLFHIFHENPLPFHITSVIYHSINTVLIFFILKSLFPTISSLLGALFFAVHPIHTEAVSWISGDGYLVTTMITLLTLFLYYRRYYFYSIILYALFIYPYFGWLFYLPLLILVYELSLNRGYNKLLLSIPYFLISATVCILKIPTVLERFGSISKGNVYDPQYFTCSVNPLIAGIHSIASNLFLMFFPVRLTLYHEPQLVTLIPFIFESFVVVSIVCLIPYLFKKAKPLFFGVMTLIICLIPSYSPRILVWLVAERYLYLPSILFSCVIAWVYVKFSKKLGNTLLIIYLLLFMAYSYRTIARNEDYRSLQRYWESTVQASPYSPRSYNELGRAFFINNDLRHALENFQKSCSISPTYSVALNNAGNIYDLINQKEKAAQCYEEALKYSPNIFSSNFNCGIIYLNSDMFDKAVIKLRKAHELMPSDTNVSKALDLAERGLKGEKLLEIKKGVKNVATH